MEQRGKRIDSKGILIGIAVFLTSGGVMVAQKWMGLYFSDESVSAYNLYSFAVTFLILCDFSKKGRISEKKTAKCIVLSAFGSGLSLCVISLVMTKLAGSLPSVILFPLYNGLGILFVCVTSAFFFKEKITLRKAIGLLLGIGGLYLINL